MKKTGRKSPRRKASALAFALIIAICLAAGAVAVLGVGVQEHRLTTRNVMLREATNAVESTVNNGISQIVARVGNSGQFSGKLLVGSPLSVPTIYSYGYGQGANANGVPVRGKNGEDGLSAITDPASQVTLRGGMAYVPSKAYQIPPGNPTTARDSFKGQFVTSKTFPLLATANVIAADGTSIKVYAKAELVVRDANLFSYAIFYNTIPLEMAPGGPMVVNGNIRANSSVDKNGNIIAGSGDLYMGGASGNVSVLGTVAASGSIFYGRNSASGQSTANAASGGVWNVPFRDTNGSGAFDNVTGITYDGTDSDKDGDPFTYAKDAELVSMRIADQTGKITFLDSTHKDANGNNDWATLGQTLTNGNVQDSANGVKPVTLTGFKNPSDGALINRPPLDKSDPAYDADKEAVKFSNKAGLYVVVEPDGTVTGFQNATDAATYKSINQGGAKKTREVRDAWIAANGSKVLDLSSAGAFSTKSALYDNRESKNIATVSVDVGALRGSINGGSTPLAFKDGTPYALDTPSSAGWNGVMYVDVENPSSGWTANGHDTSMTAVKLVDASVVPDRSQTNAAGTPGFTVATNAPLYTVGNVNADGDMGTGSNSMPDSKSTRALGRETPMCIAADAVTTLSGAWDDESSFSGSTPTPTNTEISSALLVGVVKSQNSQYSGGVENFPRLQESWNSGIKLRIRGSMVAMFESTYATGQWGKAKYGIPSRDWGFSAIFGSGAYPPGSPCMRSFRRMNYRLISAAEYDAELKSSWTNDDGSVTAKYP